MQQLAGSLGWPWLLRGLAAEGLRWLELGLGAVDGAPPAHLDVAAVDPAALLWTSALHATAGSLAEPRLRPAGHRQVCQGAR